VHQEEEPMQALRRTASVVLFPTIACLVAACDRTGLPTEPQSTAVALPASHDAAFSGVVLWVNDDGVPNPPGNSCNDPDYQRIQDAVNAAGPGDRINVCPGTYVEQVTVATTGKSNIQLRSTKRWEAIIKAPAVMSGPPQGQSIVQVSGATNVTILAFTITGPGSFCGGSIGYGVRVDNDGSANILGNHITDIRDPYVAGQPCGSQNGMGVVIGQQFNDPDPSTGSAKIEGNVVERYQKNGIVVGGDGSTAEIRANRVFGFGPTSTIAQNGIEVIKAAKAEIEHNFSSGHLYTPQTATPTGVLLYQAGEVQVNHNTVAKNDADVYAFNSSAITLVSRNKTRAATFDGIVVDLVSNVTVGNNHTEKNGGPGIGLYDGASSNMIENNQVQDNSNDFGSTPCPTSCGGGILLDDADNNSIGSNHIRNNGTVNTVDNTDGIRVNAASTGNNIHDNHLKHNLTHDCHDDALPGANTWTNNKGQTSLPPTLCGQDDNDTFESESAYGWDASYPWYDAFDGAADPELDWATAYAGIDTDSILQLLPSIRLGSVVKRTVSP
jgi:parallel beta-helix repeat protein